MEKKKRVTLHNQELHGCNFCSGYDRIAPCIIEIDEMRNLAIFRYTCGNCYNINKITYKMDMCEVYDQKGMPVKDPDRVDDYKIKVDPGDFCICPKCGYPVNWANENKAKGLTSYKCPNCSKEWEYTT